MCVCVCVCMCVCALVCECVVWCGVCVCVCVCVRACIRVPVCMRVRACVRACVKSYGEWLHSSSLIMLSTSPLSINQPENTVNFCSTLFCCWLFSVYLRFYCFMLSMIYFV